MTASTTERIDGPTPNGGAYMLAEWKDFHGSPVAKADAIQVEVHEYDADDRLLVTTYATVRDDAIAWPGRTDRAPWSDGRFTDELWGLRLIVKSRWQRLLRWVRGLVHRSR